MSVLPRTIPVSDEDLDWLREAKASNVSYARMARHLNCCVDTLKRILQRHGIDEFSAAKYVAIKQAETTWSRPCMSCGSTEPRPRNLYLCDSCRSKA